MISTSYSLFPLFNKETVTLPSPLNISFLWFLKISYKVGQVVDALDHHPDSQIQKMAANHTNPPIMSKSKKKN